MKLGSLPQLKRSYGAFRNREPKVIQYQSITGVGVGVGNKLHRQTFVSHSELDLL